MRADQGDVLKSLDLAGASQAAVMFDTGLATLLYTKSPTRLAEFVAHLLVAAYETALEDGTTEDEFSRLVMEAKPELTSVLLGIVK